MYLSNVKWELKHICKAHNCNTMICYVNLYKQMYVYMNAEAVGKTLGLEVFWFPPVDLDRNMLWLWVNSQ